MAKDAAPTLTGSYPIDTGLAEIESDPYGANRYILKVNGVPSSHVDLDDPGYLDFEYMRWMEPIFLEGYPPEDYDGRARKLRVLHLGGGGCSMARWVASRYENARQVVVELDAKLAELVRTNFQVPRAPLVRLRVGDAVQVLPTLSENSRDVVIRDVFAGSTTPRQLTTVGYARHHNATSIAGWGYSSGAALAALNAKLFDALILTFPDLASVGKLPEEIRGSVQLGEATEWPSTFVQIATHDEVAARPEGLDGLDHVTTRDYVARHRISTPKIARERIKDVAEFLKTVSKKS